MNWKADQLEATPLRDGRWAVRPIGQLGTMGWSPRAWTAVFVTAYSASRAIDMALRQMGRR